MISKLSRRTRRVLIVDDEPSNVALLKRLLAGAGLDPIFSTNDSTKAVDVFLSVRPDLVILDLSMPGMDGFDVMSALKLAVAPADFPSVVIITGDQNPATRKRALAMGAKDFINKPFDGDEVRLRIRNVLGTVELQQKLRAQNTVLASNLSDRTTELEEARIESVEQLALMAELRDDITGQHNARVAGIARQIAEAIGPRSELARLIGRVAALHDIGKIGIPDRILLKPGPLSAEEWETMKTHTTIGARILSSARSDFMLLAKEIARSHHERWDGAGYPDGLCSTRIPLSARIVTIADVFDALSSDRPYRPAYSVREAREAIERGSGTLFDPSLVKVFRGIYLKPQARGAVAPVVIQPSIAQGGLLLSA